MNAWIDMDNSPHVHLLIPFIRTLERQNYSTCVTARDYAQTIELLNESGIPFTKIGTHGGADKSRKVVNLVGRVLSLVKFANKKKFSIAINHGSRAQALACKILGIPCFIGMDYEHTESRIFSFCATRIWMPELLFPAALPIIGIQESKVLTYQGIKEQFYLSDFAADPMFKQKNAIPEDKVLVVLRPPADMANYHDRKSEYLIDKVIQTIRSKEDLYTICTPRTSDQMFRYKKYESPVFRVAENALDGKSLAYFADVMISGGGTMNREAAFFGAHVYSIFSGPKPMVDVELQKRGLLTFIESPGDCQAIEFKTKTSVNRAFSNPSHSQITKLVEQFVQLSNPA